MSFDLNYEVFDNVFVHSSCENPHVMKMAATKDFDFLILEKVLHNFDYRDDFLAAINVEIQKLEAQNI